MMEIPTKTKQNRLLSPHLIALLASFCIHGLIFALVYRSTVPTLRNAPQLTPSNLLQKSPLRLEIALVPNLSTAPQSRATQTTLTTMATPSKPIRPSTSKLAKKDNIAPSPAPQSADNLTLNTTPTQDKTASAQEATVTFSTASYQLGAAATPKPIYPEESILYGESGVVLLQLQINAQGKVSSTQLGRSSGFKRLDRAAMNSVKHWTFTPALRNQIAVDSQKQVAIRFELIDNAAVIR